MAYSLDKIRGLGLGHAGVIHVGAHMGQEVGEYKKTGMQWAVLIEPLDGPFARLREVVGDDPKMLPVQALCAARAGQACDFYIADNGAISSSMLKPKRHLIEAPAVDFPTRIKIVSTTLDAIIANLEATVADFALQSLDILTVNVQGAEIQVLKGASRVLQHMRFVSLSVCTGGLYENETNFEELRTFLKCYGFRLTDFAITRQGWGHAFFVKPSA